MATTTQDELYKTFLQVQGQQASALSDVNMTLAGVLAQVQDLRSVTPLPNAQTTSASSSPSTAESTAEAGGVGDTLTSVASTVLKSGFGLAPLVTGLFSLFGGGDAEAPPPLVKYAMPAAVNFQAAETSDGMSGFDYDQSGTPRTYRTASTIGSQPAASVPVTDNAAGAPGSAPQAPQITVNVQAMDARSFMDRSNDIALAVRDAMLNMNAINDVVNEL